MAIPSAVTVVACRADNDETEEAVRTFCRRAVDLGAWYGIEANAPELMKHLRAALKAYVSTDEVQLILDVGGEAVERPGLLELLGKRGSTSRVIERTSDGM